ncbi:hypothetical protein [Streptomyces californicus]|uniref:hypothetical protein n=1 Tax=Streptomyces californicus TaxID=67351 RepID=UPI0036A0B07D
MVTRPVPETFAADDFALREEEHGPCTGRAHFGHDPISTAERVGGVVRLTYDAYGTDGSPVTELPADQVRGLVSDAEQDVRDFLGLAGARAGQHLPTHAAPVTAALARALGLVPSP